MFEIFGFIFICLISGYLSLAIGFFTLGSIILGEFGTAAVGFVLCICLAALWYFLLNNAPFHIIWG